MVPPTSIRMNSRVTGLQVLSRSNSYRDATTGEMITDTTSSAYKLYGADADGNRFDLNIRGPKTGSATWREFF